MEFVSQFNENNTDIIDHGEEHFSYILGLALFDVLRLDPRYLRHSIDQVGHF